MYQLTPSPDILIRLSDNASVARGTWLWPQEWLDQGNVPDPIPAPVLTATDYAQAIQRHLDATAALRGWDSIYTATTRAGYPGPWHDEGIAFATWMDACWAASHQIWADVLAGKRAQPTVEQVVAELPTAPTF